MSRADLTADDRRSRSAPADSAISMQCDASNSVANVKAMLVFEGEPLVFSAAVTAAKAAATPAMETAECSRALSTLSLSFFFTVLLANSLLNHFPIDPVLRELIVTDFKTLPGCKKMKIKIKHLQNENRKMYFHPTETYVVDQDVKK